jgi:enoyl-CoA hydratase/carnithine racemase
MMSGTAIVLTQDVGSVRILVLNRPEARNAMGDDMAEAICDVLRASDADEAVRVCVVTGQGDRAFSAGANLQDESMHRTVSMDDHLAASRPASRPRWFRDVLNFRKPLLAAVNGYAIGGGCLLALCADMILASTNAEFALPQATLGILPEFGCAARLSQWVGRGRAMELCLSGRRVGATEAASIGLASAVTPQEELMDTAIALAGQIAKAPALGVALTKESINLAMEGSIASGSIADLYRYAALSASTASIARHEAWRTGRRVRKGPAA